MKILKLSLFIASLALAAFAHSACTKSEQSDQAKKPRKQNGAARRKETGSPMTRTEAEQKVLKKSAEGYLISSELQWEEGKLFYEIEAKVGGKVREVTIEAATGKVVENEDNTPKFRADSTAGKAPLWAVNLAERDAAEQAALQAYPGETQQWKAVADSGRAAFSFRIKSASGETKKVVVKAGTNEVLKIKY
jgi:uncharacterized membrane protein YkoI